MSKRISNDTHVEGDVYTISPAYIQITREFFNRLPRFKMPFPLYASYDDMIRPVLGSRPGDRFTRDQHEVMGRLCSQGMLFMSRQDMEAYKRLLAENLDLVASDPCLSGFERAEIFSRGITAKAGAFFEQPSPATLDAVRAGALALTGWLHADHAAIHPFFQLDGDHGLPWHGFKTMIFGLAAFQKMYEGRHGRRHLDDLALGLLLHDSGMTRIPGFVVNKPTSLQILEFEKVKRHPAMGVDILRAAGIESVDTLNCVAQHHERLDGGGYPQRSRNGEITLLGRIAGVADSLAAMTSDRPHAKARGLAECLHELARDRRRYDSTVAKALLVFVLTELS